MDQDKIESQAQDEKDRNEDLVNRDIMRAIRIDMMAQELADVAEEIARADKQIYRHSQLMLCHAIVEYKAKQHKSDALYGVAHLIKIIDGGQ